MTATISLIALAVVAYLLKCMWPNVPTKLLNHMEIGEAEYSPLFFGYPHDFIFLLKEDLRSFYGILFSKTFFFLPTAIKNVKCLKKTNTPFKTHNLMTTKCKVS